MQKHFEISDKKFIKIKSLIIKESNNKGIDIQNISELKFDN